MKNFKEKNKIFKKLMPSFRGHNFSVMSINQVLSKYSIKESQFYSYFPDKVTSLCKYYFIYISNQVFKRLKSKIKIEKSISKKILIILSEFFIVLNKEKEISIFFLNYLSRHPIQFKRISLDFADNVWYYINDNSTDFNYYTKSMISD